VHYEDLWVHLVDTALSLRVGPEPGTLASREAVRQVVRDTTFEDHPGMMPVPGGGVFSARVSDTLGEMWTGWREAPMPSSFAAAGSIDP